MVGHGISLSRVQVNTFCVFCKDLRKFKVTQSATVDTIEESKKKHKSEKQQLDSSGILEPNVQYLLDSTMTYCQPSTSCKASAIPDSHATRTGLAAEMHVASRVTNPPPL